MYGPLRKIYLKYVKRINKMQDIKEAFLEYSRKKHRAGDHFIRYQDFEAGWNAAQMAMIEMARKYANKQNTSSNSNCLVEAIKSKK